MLGGFGGRLSTIFMSLEQFLPLPNKILLHTRYSKLDDETVIKMYFYTDGTYHGNNWHQDCISEWKIINEQFHFKHSCDQDFHTDRLEEEICLIAQELKAAMAEREWLDE